MHCREFTTSDFEEAVNMAKSNGYKKSNDRTRYWWLINDVQHSKLNSKDFPPLGSWFHSFDDMHIVTDNDIPMDQIRLETFERESIISACVHVISDALPDYVSMEKFKELESKVECIFESLRRRSLL